VRSFHYRWEWSLQSSPEALWPLVTDTNRFNRDVGVPNVERLAASAGSTRRLRLQRIGVPIEWEEEPFEWTRPSRFGVVRRYISGPVTMMRVLVELTPAGSGTMLVYQVWAQPKNVLGLLAIPAEIGGLSARRIDRTIRRYDRLASAPGAFSNPMGRVRLAPGGADRLRRLAERLAADGADADLVARLSSTIAQGDDLAVAQFRPYAFADAWRVPRRGVLELCLKATRIGLLEFRWRLLCPLCRGSREGLATLADVGSRAHCESCHIDFTANFERSVELTFRPSAAIRELDANEFCVGGPQITPHIVAQQLLPAGASRALTLPLEAGRYRVRTPSTTGGVLMAAASDGAASLTIRAVEGGWPDGEPTVSLQPSLRFENTTDQQQLFVLERMAWTDQAATAAEVTALQLFRDLFASEALRPGEECSVGSVAIVFTDLRSSTQMYREIGDAVAFGHVLGHFDVVKALIAEEGGAVVKTIGDAVMAVFTRPVCALRAMIRAQVRLASPADGSRPLALKVGMHYGPCIAVTLNDRLDYFGSTINIAARLEGQSSGRDVIVSDAVRHDPEVAAWLAERADTLEAQPLDVSLKGFDERFSLWRVVNRVRVGD
jgi:class 3 adenylate cyclase